MYKAKLTELIRNNYSGNRPEELIEWVSSPRFENDLNQYIEEDLLVQMNDNGKNHGIDLTHIIDEILAIAKLQNIVLRDSNFTLSERSIDSKSTEVGRNKKFISKMVLKIAASVALVAASIFVYYGISQYHSDSQLSTNFIIKENPKGRKSTIFLKDGSKVILNSESSITYDENFSSTSREIVLTGEAFFYVAKNPNKPFIVKSGEISTTALGTSFNVRNFKNENITVSLIAGKVNVEKTGNHFNHEQNTLLPGEKITYIRSSNEFAKLKYNDSEELLWKDGILSFDQSSIPTAFARLERWYGVSIITNSRDHKDVSYGAIYKDQSLEQVLEAMGFTLNFDYSIEGKKVNINFKR
ncbi:MAG: transmembrane sensor [Cyclobacteriaceae bacterium]